MHVFYSSFQMKAKSRLASKEELLHLVPLSRLQGEVGHVPSQREESERRKEGRCGGRQHRQQRQPASEQSAGREAAGAVRWEPSAALQPPLLPEASSCSTAGPASNDFPFGVLGSGWKRPTLSILSSWAPFGKLPHREAAGALCLQQEH